MNRIILYLLLSISIIGIEGCRKKEFKSEQDYYNLLKTEPAQEKISEIILDSNYTEAELRAVASYKVSARVLSKESYRFDKGSTYSPIDLTLGWGEMADKDKLEMSNISISQGNRFYFWSVPSFNVFERRYIETHSANTHIVPADDDIKSYVKDMVKENDVIYLEGFLINIRDIKNNGGWHTSLSRGDTGAGACEIFYVTKIVHLP